MTLQQLKYAVTAADKGTMSEAAQSLFVAQPSLTNAIKDLENELGITIFHRTNKGIIISNSAYFSSGAYDPVAEVLFGKENVNAYYLEFDDERSGGFEPLKFVSGDKKVVLGLITTKSPVLEDKQTVIDRIRKAAEIIPLERLYLSPQCGFASCEIGNKLTEEQQWAKIRLLNKIAKEVWGE